MATPPVNTNATTNTIVDATSNLVATLTRTGVALVSAPLSMLPEQVRVDATNAAGGMINAVGNLHLSILKAVVSGVNTASQEVDKALKDVNIPGGKK